MLLTRFQNGYKMGLSDIKTEAGMENNAVAASLRALATANQGRSKIGRIRELYPEIENAKKAGVSLEKILETLNEQGLDMKLASFKTMLHRVRKEVVVDKKAMPAIPQPASFTPRKDDFPQVPENEVVGADSVSNDDLEGLSAKQRREKRADQFIKPVSTNPLLKHIKEKKQ